MKVKYLIITAAILISSATYSQNGKLENETLIIYNEYTPVVKDANRILSLPIIIDTIKISPKFEYNIKPSVYKTNFTPTQINVATIKGESLPKLNNGMVKLGLGNYMTPYMEGFFNTKRETYYSAGIYAKHHSSHGKTKNKEGTKIYNGYANTELSAFGKRFYNDLTINADLGLTSNIVNFYGYDQTAISELHIPNLILPRDRNEMESINYMRLFTNVGVQSNNISKNKIDYLANLKYQYFYTTLKNNQNKIVFDADVNKMFNGHRFGLETELEYNNYNDSINVATVDNPDGSMQKYTEKYTFLNISPYYKYSDKIWKLRFGVDIISLFNSFEPKYPDNIEPKYYFCPNVYLQHNISNVVIPYVSYRKYIENNDFERLSKINPFINKDLYYYNVYETSYYQHAIDIGIKGNVSKNLYFNVNANYSKIDNIPLFINEHLSLNNLGNKFFCALYDVERVTSYAEVALKDFHKFNFIIKGHYYYYTELKSKYEYRDNEGHKYHPDEKPWHLPTADITLRTEYKFDEKLSFGINFDFVSTRYARELIGQNPITGKVELNAKKLNPIFDISLFGEYNIDSNFSGFIQLNNITAQKQYYWNNYQSLGFNVLLGVKYLF